MDLNFVFLFFIYGLAFFLMGFAILLYPKRDSSFALAKSLLFIAGFGILHGINEWIDMFLILQKSEFLRGIRTVILPVSFLFLVQFGVKVVVETGKRTPYLKALPYILFLSWLAIVLTSGDRLLMGDIWARYLIGAPGIFLTSYALILKLKTFHETKLPGVEFNLKLAAGAFVFYGIFSGLIVPKAGFFPAALFNYAAFLDTVGIPVQVFRAACAVIAAYGMIRLLDVFDYETGARVRKSEELFRNIFDHARDGILLADEKTKKFHTGNRTACKMLGYSLEDLKNLSIPDIHPDKDIPYIMERLERVSRRELTLLKNIPVKRKDGTIFFADINPSVITLEGKNYLMGIFRDITERKAAEEKNRKHLEQIASLHSIDLAISSSHDLSVTLDIILKYILDQLKVDAVDVLLYKPHLHTLEYASGCGFRTKALQYTRLKIGESHAGKVAIERKMIAVPDMGKADDGFKRSAHLEEEGFVSYYGIPLIAKGEVKGVMEVFTRTAIKPDPEWLNFLATLAGQAAIAVDNALLFNDLQLSNVELTMAYDETIEGWSRALDLRDKETEGHSQRVTELTLKIAAAAGVTEAEQSDMRRGALLHDIGKMGIPDNILLKPGPLDDEEMAIMRKHPVFAYELLSHVRFLKTALDIPYCHHEKWDGTGYPRGLKGEQIPLSARIFALADVFDALCSARPYRPAWAKDKVLEHIRSLSGNHLDPKIVEKFFSMDQGKA